MRDVLRVARKELAAFFASPVAYIFLAAFLAATLFAFFWVDTFFARNIADVRPLFEWMPLLLIFLVAALTMRMWSEERRAGTLEMLMTAPVPPLRLVLGKFLACLGLVALALALTLPLPVTVSLLGPLDWGPVIGGYVATLFLAAAYTAVGLFVSARSDSQIVSLIGTALIGGLFYLVGSDALTSLFGNRAGEFLKLLGTGSRFDSITRGVIDLRDIYYYLSIVGVFLTLNVLTLERLRWAADAAPQAHRHWRLVTGLAIVNFMAANLWLQPVGWARVDVTKGNIYSISDATRGYLAQLQEPLLIRGYFSAKTHPLLAPLVPQLRDLLKEYEVVGNGRVRVEFVDPLEDPDLEREANEKYGIRPVPFQTMSKYQAAVVNSYFDVLVQYGDEYEKLGFRDLIEVKATSEADIDVRLRDPEYDITRSIKKVLYGYQGGASVFAHLTKPVTLRGFISANDKLPDLLAELRQDLDAVVADLQGKAQGKLAVDIRDPDADAALAREIDEKYGFKPMVASLLDPQPFYFYLVLEADGQTVPVALPQELNKGGLERSLDAGLKRTARGLLRTIALYAPESRSPFGMGGKRYDLLKSKLQENARLQNVDLKSGRLPEEVDLLLVIGPRNLDDKQIFAMDQFLMQGGTVMVAASPFDVDLGHGAIFAQKRPTGLESWLAHHGVELGDGMVLDPQNTPFPIPVQRNIGGFTIQEIRSVPYPYFADIREDGMDRTSGILAGLPQVTMNWAGPLQIDADKNQDRKVTRLLESSAGAWVSDSAEVQPNFASHGALGFPVGQDKGRQLLAAVVEGRFTSYFQGKPSPLAQTNKADEADDADADQNDAQAKDEPVIAPVIDHSPAAARLIVFGSDSFLSDQALDLAAGATQTRYLNPVQLVENAVDWALEDRGLLSLRGRSQFSRLLRPMEDGEVRFWEYLNYGLALAGLGVIFAAQRLLRARRMRYYQQVLEAGRI